MSVRTPIAMTDKQLSSPATSPESVGRCGSRLCAATTVMLSATTVMLSLLRCETDREPSALPACVTPCTCQLLRGRNAVTELPGLQV